MEIQRYGESGYREWHIKEYSLYLICEVAAAEGIAYWYLVCKNVSTTIPRAFARKVLEWMGEEDLK